jgi:homoserine kinase type II
LACVSTETVGQNNAALSEDPEQAANSKGAANTATRFIPLTALSIFTLRLSCHHFADRSSPALMAVYTEVTDGMLNAFLAQYDLGDAVAFRGIAEGVENSNYALRTTRGDFILTLYEKRVDPADLPWFLGLLEHLAQHGLPCALPVRARNGANLNRLAGKAAAITTFLPGVWPREPTIAHCAELGAALAQLHQAGADYPTERPNTLGPAAWAPLWSQCRDHANAVEPGLQATLDHAVAGIIPGWPTALPRGQIHADLFPDNVFFLDGKISGLIDFYFAATDFFALDIAICLNAWCFEPDFTFNPGKSAALLRGYQQIRPLTHAEQNALPLLCQGAALRFLLTRLYDWQNTPEGALVTKKDPRDYLRRLMAFQHMPDGANYGL